MRGAVLLIVVAAVAADAAGLRGRGAAEAAAGGTPAGYTLPAVSSGKKHAMTSAQTLGFFIKANEGAGTGSGRGYAGTVLPQKLHVRPAASAGAAPRLALPALARHAE